MAKTSPAVIGRGPFDYAIVNGFSRGWSAEEVSTNDPIRGTLTPTQCLSRLTQLIKSKDVLDAKDRLALLLEDIYWIRNKFRDQMEKMEVLDEKQVGAYIKILEAAAKRIETANVGMNEAMLKFNEVRAGEFVAALTHIVGVMFTLLTEKHPEIDTSEVNTIVLEAIPESIPEVR